MQEDSLAGNVSVAGAIHLAGTISLAGTNRCWESVETPGGHRSSLSYDGALQVLYIAALGGVLGLGSGRSLAG